MPIHRSINEKRQDDQEHQSFLLLLRAGLTVNGEFTLLPRKIGNDPCSGVSVVEIQAQAKHKNNFDKSEIRQQNNQL